MAVATVAPAFRARRLGPRPWFHAVRCSASSASPPPSLPEAGTSEAPTPPHSTRSFFPKRGQTLELVCESLAFKAKGVCKVADTGFVVMCDRALPGERFLGRVSRKKGNYAEVTKLETIAPHRDAVDAPCEYASDCGGCKTQNLLYEAQVRAKEQQVHDLIIHVGRFSDDDPDFSSVLKPIVPCDVRYHYRNKMEFSFGAQRWIPKDELAGERDASAGGSALGLHAPGFFDKVLHVEKCLLQSQAANKVLAVIQDNWKDPDLGLSPYDVHAHNGFLKHLMLRTGRDVKTGFPELMVNFVTSCYKPELLEPLVNMISDIPEVVSIMNNVNTSVGNTSVGEEEYTLFGKSIITETLRGLTFQISANSFFQTNSYQAEVLYKLIEDCAGLKGDGSEIVLDLFCGTGTIGLTLARSVSHVYGYEVVPEAISDARRNAELNDIHNATFVQGDLNKITDSFGKDFPKPDIVISDPNRPGMHLKLIKYLLKLRAPRIIYVSCNPATCARDLDYLCHDMMNVSGGMPPQIHARTPYGISSRSVGVSNAGIWASGADSSHPGHQFINLIGPTTNAVISVLDRLTCSVGRRVPPSDEDHASGVARTTVLHVTVDGWVTRTGSDGAHPITGKLRPPEAALDLMQPSRVDASPAMVVHRRGSPAAALAMPVNGIAFGRRDQPYCRWVGVLH